MKPKDLIEAEICIDGRSPNNFKSIHAEKFGEGLEHFAYISLFKVIDLLFCSNLVRAPVKI